MNREDINKYSFWVREINSFPSYLDELKPSKKELTECLKYIKIWKDIELKRICALLSYNPNMTSSDAKTESYKQYENVEVIINDYINTKIIDIQINYSIVKTKRDQARQAIMFYVNQIGGIDAALNEIREAYKTGDLTKKQAHDLRQQINDANKYVKKI